MRYTLYRAVRTFLTVQRFLANYKNFPSIALNSKIKTFGILAATTATIAQLTVEESNDGSHEIESQSLNEVRNACIKNDNALKELMEVLCACVIEISKEYQANIRQQIDIITKCTKLGPVGEHWDELTKFRVEATQLREELTKYEALVQKVGQMTYNQAVTSLLSGIENAMDLLEIHYGDLEKTVLRLSKENCQWETKLLKANRDSILHGLN